MLLNRVQPLIRSTWRLLVALCLLLTSLASTAPSALAAGFVVNTTADTADTAPGNGICADSGGMCSLRAAIQESNALAGTDTITVPAGTYTLASQLVIEDNLTLNGAGKGVTILDGNNASELIWVRTIELLVCDSGNNSVASYDRHGARNVDFLSGGAGGMDIPGALALGPESDLFVTAFGSGVHRFSGTGKNEGLFVDPADVPAPIFAPTDAVFANSGALDFDMFVADYFPGERILRVDRITGAISTFVAKNAGGLSTPSNLAIHNDDLYVTSTGTDQVLRYNGANGNFVEAFVSAGSGGLSTPRGLVFRDNHLLVANEDGDSILRYNANNGNFINAFVASGSGGLDKPSDLTFGPDGHLYVISRGNKSILRYNGTTGAFLGTFVTGGDVFLSNPACLLWRVGAGDGPIVSISGVTLQNGQTMQTGGPTAGLGVDQGANVTLRESAVRSNDSSTFGGGIQNWGNLTIVDSEITDNTLPEGGGGQTSQGGGIFNVGILKIERSLIANNFATRGGGISNTNQGRVDLTNVTISGNRSFGAGGGLRNVADGIMNINASTITNNRANEPGGSGESERKGGGIYNADPARISIANTILAGNSDNRSKFDSDFSPDCYSPTPFRFTSHRDNLVGILTANCVLRDTTWGDTRFEQVGTPDTPLDPKLQPLAFNGGTIRSHALQFGSPALDEDNAVTSADFFDCPATDQRGTTRPQGPDCDIGAFETQQAGGSAGSGAKTDFSSKPTVSGEIGISGQINNAPGGGTMNLLAMMGSTNPTAVPLRSIGNRFVQLNITGGSTGDTTLATFYYPASVTPEVEGNAGFQLLYFDGTAWQPVKSDGGAAPSKDTSDNSDSSVSGGRISLTFGATSEPALAQINNVAFAFALRNVEQSVYVPLALR
jgi:CSLREA domain-containing protein